MPKASFKALSALALLLALGAPARAQQAVTQYGVRYLPKATKPTNCTAGKPCEWSDNAATPNLRYWDGTNNNYTAACVPTISGDVCAWNGTNFVRAPAGGGGGYVSVADEGTPLTAQTTLNFTGAGVSCVNNGGASRTDCTIAGGGSTGNWTFTGDAADDSGAAVLTIGATTATGVTIGRTAGANILAADTTLASGKTLTGAAASDLYLNAVTGQLVRLRVNGSNMLSVSSTAATLTVPLVMTGTQTGTYTLGGTPTITAPVVSGGLTASGSASNDFSASTGTFKTSTGTLTVSGDLQMGSGKHIYGGASTSAADFSAGSGIFKTTTGAATFGGSSNTFTNGLTSDGDVNPVNDNTEWLGTASKRWIIKSSLLDSLGPTVAADNTSTDGAIRLVNSTAATVGAQKYSPVLAWWGNGWQTDTGASESTLMQAQLVPVQGAAHPTVGLSFQSNVNGAGWVERFNIGNTAITASVPYSAPVLSGSVTGTYNIAGTPTATSPILANLGATTISSPWTAVTYQNSYVDFGGNYSGSGYYKNALGIVYVRIAAKSGTAGAVIFTLPAGYRPAGYLIFAMYVDDNSTSSKMPVQVKNNGEVSCLNSFGTTDVIGMISFPAEN